jgi:glucose-6-phosphate 1-dehydrogenase
MSEQPNKWPMRVARALHILTLLLLVAMLYVSSLRVTAVEAQNEMLLKALERIAEARGASR